MLNEEEIKDYFQRGFYEDYYGWCFTEEESQREVEHVLELLDAKHDHILDWCGNWGRYSLYFAKKGFQVTILDYIRAYLDLAKQKFKENGLLVSTIDSDCRKTPSTIQADFGTCLLNSIGFLKKYEQLKTFKSIYGTFEGTSISFDSTKIVLIAQK